MVSYARSTYEKSKQFNEKLNELQKTIDPIAIRTYLAGKKSNNPDIEQNLDLSEDDVSKLEELKALRMSGIQGEMKYALAQAQKSGVKLPEQIVSGESIVPGFSQAVLDKVPSLGVYNLFMLFTEKELAAYLDQLKSGNEKQAHTTPDDEGR